MSRKTGVSALFFIVWATVLTVTPATAQRPDAPTYAERGPYDVGTREFTLPGDGERPLNGTVWYPAAPADGAPAEHTYRLGRMPLQLENTGFAVPDAPPNPEAAPYPLVVYSHGSGGTRFLTLFLLEHLASYGIVVMAVDHPGNNVFDRVNVNALRDNTAANYAYRPLDILRTFEHAETLNTEGDFAGLIDTERSAVLGHSFGGYTAMAVAGARLNTDALPAWCAANAGVTVNDLREPWQPDDPRLITTSVCDLGNYAEEIAALRGLDAVPEGVWPATSWPEIDAVVTYAPFNAPIFGAEGLAEVTVPALTITGTADGAIIPERDPYAMHAEIRSEEKLLVTLENADHYIFLDECPQIIIDFGYYESCSDPIWDTDRAHDLTNHLTTAFLLAVLNVDADAAAALQPAALDFPGVNTTAQ